MDLSAISSLSRYAYQASQAAGSPTPTAGTGAGAVLKALQGAYSGSQGVNGLFTTSDPLTAQLSQGAVLQALVGGMASTAQAAGTPLDVSGLQATFATVGGLDAASADSLFSGSRAANLFPDAVFTQQADLALAAYTYQQQQAAMTMPTGTTAADVAQAVQSAQASSLNAYLNVLG